MEWILKVGLLEFMEATVIYLSLEQDIILKEKNSSKIGVKNLKLVCFMILKINLYHTFITKSILELHLKMSLEINYILLLKVVTKDFSLKLKM